MTFVQRQQRLNHWHDVDALHSSSSWATARVDGKVEKLVQVRRGSAVFGGATISKSLEPLSPPILCREGCLWPDEGSRAAHLSSIVH